MLCQGKKILLSQPGLIAGYLGTWIIFTNKVWSNQEWNHKWQLRPLPNIVDLSWCFPIFSSTQLQNLFLIEEASHLQI